MNPFEGCWQRIDRAQVHGNTLAELWRSFNTNDAYTTTINYQDDGTGEVFVSPSEKDWRTPFSLEFGEMLYQLRAAIDSCIYVSAVLQLGQDPPPNENNWLFPICSTPAKFKESSRRIAKLSDEIRMFIESVQPYQATPVLVNVDGKQWNLNMGLGFLNELARKDRHRKLHVAGSIPTGGRIQIGPLEGMSVENVSFGTVDILENKSKLGTFNISNFSREQHINVNLELSLEIAIEGVPFGPKSNSFGIASRALIISGMGVITKFEKFFGIVNT